MQMLLGKSKSVKMLNKKLGVICEDGIFRIYKKEIHKFRIYDGWGINKGLLKELQDVGVKAVEIHTEKRILKANIETVWIAGIPYQNPKGEKDYQLIVPEKYFKILEVK